MNLKFLQNLSTTSESQWNKGFGSIFDSPQQKMSLSQIATITDTEKRVSEYQNYIKDKIAKGDKQALIDLVKHSKYMMMRSFAKLMMT